MSPVSSKPNSFWHKSKPQSSEQIKNSQNFKSKQIKLKIEFRKFHIPNHFIKQKIEASQTNIET